MGRQAAAASTISPPTTTAASIPGSINFDPLSNDKPIPGNLFRVDPPGTVTKLWDGIEVTNGLGFSPDRKHLYHCDSTTGAVWAYDVTADGGVKDRRIFAKLPEGWPDGMAVDVEGGVWVAAVRVGRGRAFQQGRHGRRSASRCRRRW